MSDWRPVLVPALFYRDPEATTGLKHEGWIS